jgi:hypothetical protein
MSAAAPLHHPALAASSALPPGVPVSALRHLGLTAAHILALEVLGVSLVEAVERGVIKLPAPLTAEALPAYLETIKDWVAMGLDPNEPHDDKSMITHEAAVSAGLLREPESEIGERDGDRGRG